MDAAIDAMSTAMRHLASGRWSTRHGVSLRRRLPTLAAFVLLLATINSLRYWSSIGGSWNFDGSAVHARWLAIELATMGTGAVLGAVIAEAARWRGWRHLMLNAVATFAAVGLGAAIVKMAFAADLEAAASAGSFASGNALALHGWWFFSMAGLLFGAFANARERGLAAIRSAQIAELECIEARRAALDLRLQVLQARLDPGLLFSLLDEIGRRYEAEQPAADRLLDDLISYLRTALPSNPDAVRTLADEAALVETYLRISPSARGRGIDVATRVPAAIAGCACPPGVLLPLACDAAIAGARRIELAAACATSAQGCPAIEVTIVAVGVEKVDEWTVERQEALRRTLAKSFPASVLGLGERSEGATAVLRWNAPDERRPGRPAEGA